MKIKLLKLEIKNFQGIDEFILDVNGSNANVYGDNAIGKTSVKNSFTWLLFNKNSKGITKFGFKPKDKDGNVIHGLETSVEATFDIDNVSKTFKRVVYDKVSTIRGTNTQVYKDVSEWLVDGVPKKKSEYEKEISNLIDENIFKMITDPLYFNTQLRWEERRNILMDISGDISDDEIIKSSNKLSELNGLLNGKSVDDFREITKHQIAPIVERLDKIPVQIGEAERAIPSVDSMQFDEKQRNDLITQIDFKENEISEIIHGVEITNQKKLLESHLNIKRSLELQLSSDPRKIDDFKNEFDDISELQSNINTIQRDITSLESSIKKLDTDLNINAIDRKKLSSEWDMIFNQEFKGSICPTCKRELPEDEVEAHKREFNIKKANDLDVIESKLNVLKEAKESLNYDKSENEKELDSKRKIIVEMQSEVDKLTKEINVHHNEFISKIKDEIKNVDRNIEVTRNAISSLESDSSEVVSSLKDDVAKLKEELNAFNIKVANRDFADKQNARIKELKEEETTLAAQYEMLQKRMFLCEEFIRTKAEMLTEKINANFKLAKFKLFDIQKNDGIRETCEVTYDGVPFIDLNDAAKINIGLDIINTLCNKFDVQAPIVSDNMESVTSTIDTYSQHIKLIVDKGSKTLRLEKE